MKYSLQIPRNKNLFKRQKCISLNVLSIRLFWNLIPHRGGIPSTIKPSIH